MVQLIDTAPGLDAIHALSPRFEPRPFRLGLGAGLGWRLGRFAVDLAMLALAGAATAIGASAAGVAASRPRGHWVLRARGRAPGRPRAVRPDFRAAHRR